MKTLLFSGASGFLGRSIRPILKETYEIDTVGITQEDTYPVDLSSEIPVLKQKFDVVLHAAGKAHVVPQTKDESDAFFKVNYEGTVNLCRALERVGVPRAFIFISTVAVYGVETGENISEDHPLLGVTPYAKSKIMAEEFLQQWCLQHGCILGIIRPSLLAGRNPPGNLGAMIRGIASGHYLSIAHGRARKSVLMAEDIARLVPKLSQIGGIYNVCDDQHPSFGELEESISRQLGKKKPISIPYDIARILAIFGDLLGDKSPINSAKLRKITQPLTFSNLAAKRRLDWEPLSVLDHFEIR